MSMLASLLWLTACSGSDDDNDSNDSNDNVGGASSGNATSSVTSGTNSGSNTEASANSSGGASTAATSSGAGMGGTGGTDPTEVTAASTGGGGATSSTDATATTSSAETTGGSATTGSTVDGEVRAFPGAEGFGAIVTGGRGGRVLKVTTLAATGPGSLQAALEESGPRIIVFEVSGVIETSIIEIYNGDVTIAGQTAPGAGITIQGRLYGSYTSDVGNIIIRHLRIRPEYDGSAGDQFDGIQMSLNHHVILDHISVGFGVDETICLYGSEDVTVQWSTIESAATTGHPEGEHNYGLINGPDGRRVSVHHNLFAHNKNRNPAIANGPADVRNNVVYNVRHGFVHHNPASGSFNFVGNYYKAGNDDTLIPFYFDDENGSAMNLGYYVEGNWVDGATGACSDGELTDPWSQCDLDLIRDSSFRSNTEFDFSGESELYRPITTTSAADAYAQVLARAGAFPRDVVALRSVTETEAGTGTWGSRTPSDLMDGLTPTTAPGDQDDDGMADDWETARNLDPSDGTDHNTVMPSGYTAIEEYINELADNLVGN
jgi:pectate lyase